MKKGLTEMVFIIDRSGSMGGLEKDTIGGFNSMLKEQQAVEGEAIVTTVLFDNRYELLHDRIDIRAVSPLTEKNYTVGGNTALLDALGKTIRKIREVQEHTAEDYRAEKILFIIITDGEENASQYYSQEAVKSLLEKVQAENGWDVMFVGANIDAKQYASNLGISGAHASGFSYDSAGAAAVMKSMSLGASVARGFSKLYGDGTVMNMASLDMTKVYSDQAK